MGKFKGVSWSTIFKVDAATTEKNLEAQYKKIIKDYKPSEYPEEYLEIKDAYEYARRYVLGETASASPIRHSNSSEDKRFLKKLEENKAHALQQRKLADNKRDAFYSKVANGNINESVLIEYFSTTSNMYKEMLDFYIVFNGKLSINKITSILKASNNSYVYNAWSALMASAHVKMQNSTHTVMYSYYEKKLFESEGSDKVENFINIVKISKFTYPFNYLTEDIFHLVKAANPIAFKQYINSLKAEFIFYFDNPKLNLEVLELLTKEKRDEFITYALAVLVHDSSKTEQYKTLFTKAKELGVSDFVSKTSRVEDISSHTDYIESILLINYIRTYNISNVNYNDFQSYLVGKTNQVANVKLATKKRSRTTSTAPTVNYLVWIPVIVVIMGVLYSLTFYMGNYTSNMVDTSNTSNINYRDSKKASINGNDSQKVSLACSASVSTHAMQLEAYGETGDVYILLVTSGVEDFNTDNLYVGNRKLEDVVSGELEVTNLVSMIKVEFTYTGDKDSNSLVYEVDTRSMAECKLK